MRFNKLIPYNMKRLVPMLGLAGATLFTACSKDDDNYKEIALQEFKKAEAEWRQSVNNTRLEPYNITTYFNETFVNRALEMGITPKNSVDSAHVCIKVADVLIGQKSEYSNPLSAEIMKGKSKILISKYNELQR